MVKAVADEISATAKLKGVSGRELARRIGMSSNTMAVKLRGGSPFDIRELTQVARALDVDLVVLIGRAKATLPPSEG